LMLLLWPLLLLSFYILKGGTKAPLLILILRASVVL